MRQNESMPRYCQRERMIRELNQFINRYLKNHRIGWPQRHPRQSTHSNGLGDRRPTLKSGLIVREQARTERRSDFSKSIS